MNFNTWISTFFTEKDIDMDTVFEVESPVSGLNSVPLGVVIEHIKIASLEEQALIKGMIIKIDFYNRDVLDFMNHLAVSFIRTKEGW